MSEGFVRFVVFFPVFLFSLSFHELAHAWTANRLGDPTARLMGRLTLNPLAHIDWIGTVLFPLLMFLMPGLLLFGWARPVPVNGSRLRGGRTGYLKVSAAGPLSNLLLAVGFALIIHLMIRFPMTNLTVGIMEMLETGVYLNLMLAFFNLIPLPPLDGAGVMIGLLPDRLLAPYENWSRYSFIILFAALYLGIFRWLSLPVITFARWLLP